MYLRQDRPQGHQEALVLRQDLAQAITSPVRLPAIHPEDHPVVPLLRGHLVVHRAIHQAVRQVHLADHPVAILRVVPAVVRQVVAVHQADRQVAHLRDRQVAHLVVPPQAHLPVVQVPLTRVLTPVVADQVQAQVAVQVQDVHQHQAVHPPEDHQVVADKNKKRGCPKSILLLSLCHVERSETSRVRRVGILITFRNNVRRSEGEAMTKRVTL